ncbi:hypothetical protein CRUP_024531, partial [Coryphaenoides rupestris]
MAVVPPSCCVVGEAAEAAAGPGQPVTGVTPDIAPLFAQCQQARVGANQRVQGHGAADGRRSGRLADDHQA